MRSVSKRVNTCHRYQAEQPDSHLLQPLDQQVDQLPQHGLGHTRLCIRHRCHILPALRLQEVRTVLRFTAPLYLAPPGISLVQIVGASVGGGHVVTCAPPPTVAETAASGLQPSAAEAAASSAANHSGGGMRGYSDCMLPSRIQFYTYQQQQSSPAAQLQMLHNNVNLQHHAHLDPKERIGDHLHDIAWDLCVGVCKQQSYSVYECGEV